jgi:predicted RNase H-like HicB family nuclease
MQTQDIQAALDQMVRDLMERGAVNPEASFSLRANEGVSVRLSCTNDMFYDRGLKFFFTNTPEEALSAAQEYIAKLPDPRTVKRRQWQQKLGEVIDEGHELALPDDVMKPLHAGSQAMTDNLLEDQS